MTNPYFAPDRFVDLLATVRLLIIDNLGMQKLITPPPGSPRPDHGRL
jgi:hypothetical protein